MKSLPLTKDIPLTTSSFKLSQLFMRCQGDLELVENRIRETFSSDAPTISTISEYLLSLGGKRIRPVLALLSARLFGQETASPGLIDVAAGIELIHMATLLHDDIIDRSPTRRNKPSAYCKFGADATLLTGDFLFARAFGLCGLLDEFTIRATENACVQLIEGENLEGIIDPAKQYSLDQYVVVVEKKTAALFSLAAAVGAHMACAGDDNVELLKNFGRYSGIAFQMIDDILDITADEDLLGKPSGTDLRQKTPSLINVIWLSAAPTEAKAFFALEEPCELDCKRAVQSIIKSPVIDEARKIASEYTEKAKEALNKAQSPSLQHSISKDLQRLLTFTLKRCY